MLQAISFECNRLQNKRPIMLSTPCVVFQLWTSGARGWSRSYDPIVSFGRLFCKRLYQRTALSAYGPHSESAVDDQISKGCVGSWRPDFGGFKCFDLGLELWLIRGWVVAYDFWSGVYFANTGNGRWRPDFGGLCLLLTTNFRFAGAFRKTILQGVRLDVANKYMMNLQTWSRLEACL